MPLFGKAPVAAAEGHCVRH